MRLFEQYRSRYLVQFLMDVCIIGMLALSAAFHLVFFGALVWASMYLVMLGILGITPDGTEGRY